MTPDDVDLTQDRIEREEEIYRKYRPREYKIEPGQSGDCDYCDLFSKRLIHGECARCRDRSKGLNLYRNNRDDFADY